MKLLLTEEQREVLNAKVSISKYRKYTSIQHLKDAFGQEVADAALHAHANGAAAFKP